jgi:hypothetical protein
LLPFATHRKRIGKLGKAIRANARHRAGDCTNASNRRTRKRTRASSRAIRGEGATNKAKPTRKP